MGKMAVSILNFNTCLFVFFAMKITKETCVALKKKIIIIKLIKIIVYCALLINPAVCLLQLMFYTREK